MNNIENNDEVIIERNSSDILWHNRIIIRQEGDIIDRAKGAVPFVTLFDVYGEPLLSLASEDQFTCQSFLSDDELIKKAEKAYGVANRGELFKILMNGDDDAYGSYNLSFKHSKQVKNFTSTNKSCEEENNEDSINNEEENDDEYSTEYEDILKLLSEPEEPFDDMLLEEDDFFYYMEPIVQMAYDLCDILAFWSNGDIEQMRRIFNKSKLKEKLCGMWDDVVPDIEGQSITRGEGVLRYAICNMKGSYHKTSKNSIKDHDAIFVKIGDRIISLSDFDPENKEKYQWNDTGLSNLFADLYKGYLYYCQDRLVWFVYDGKRWIPDNLAATNLCENFMQSLQEYADCFPDIAERRGSRTLYYSDFVRKYNSRQGYVTILKSAMAKMKVVSNVFDSDKTKLLFNCQNGTYDIPEHLFYKHRSSDMITMLSNVIYDEDAVCEEWKDRLKSIFEEGTDTEETPISDYLQKVIGYSITGDTRFEKAFVFYGPTGRNGKSFIIDTILEMMGDYGCTTSPNTIAKAKFTNASGPSENVARLCGKRLVSISEPEMGLVISEALIKTYTGRDKIVARNLREGSIEFYPQFKIIINTNHKPEVSDPTAFSRLIMIPFNHRFEGDELDSGLKDRMKEKDNLSGIFNWCCKGVEQYFDGYWENLLYNENEDEFYTWDVDKLPDILEEKNKEFRLETNSVELFINELLIKGGNGSTNVKENDYILPRKEVYEKYRNWCKETLNNEYNKANFNQIMASQPGIRYARTRFEGEKNPRHCFIGIKFNEDKVEEKGKTKKGKTKTKIKKGKQEDIINTNENNSIQDTNSKINISAENSEEMLEEKNNYIELENTLESETDNEIANNSEE